MSAEERFTFKWMQFVFTVELIRSPLWKDKIGEAWADKQIIRIDAAISTGLMRTTFLHEFLHCVSDLSDLELTESQIKRLSMYLIPLLPYPWNSKVLHKQLQSLDSSMDLGIGSSINILTIALNELATSAPNVVRWVVEGKGLKE